MTCFIAYAVPQDDLHLVHEDGLGFINVGATREEALAALKADFIACYPDEGPEYWDECVTSQEYRFFTVDPKTENSTVNYNVLG